MLSSTLRQSTRNGATSLWNPSKPTRNGAHASCSARAASLLRRDDADMELAQLLRRRRRRRAHKQILRALVHREKRHLAQILLAREQHHDAIHARRHPSMRRGAVLERPVHAAESLDHRLFAVARDLEGLQHGLGTMVADAARREFVAIACNVVLERLDRERVLAKQRFKSAL